MTVLFNMFITNKITFASYKLDSNVAFHICVFLEIL